jgi:hypothetical protein
MTKGRGRQTASGIADVALVCGLAALGIGGLVAGKVALGVLCLIYLGWEVGGAIIMRRGSDAAVLRFAISRPLVLGGWFVALATVVIASRTSRDWILILPLGLVYIGIGVLLLVIYRRSRRGGERQTERSLEGDP